MVSLRQGPEISPGVQVARRGELAVRVQATDEEAGGDRGE